LGLYIVREVARAHGGDVSVTSSRNQGTTFSLRLPVANVPTPRPSMT
jgi:sigma-B regulation protein RsbU (phosphoserine phosphatase)